MRGVALVVIGAVALVGVLGLVLWVVG